MKSVTIPTMLEPLGVMPSCSRPAVSNDPFSEVLFKTLKYRSSYPHRPCQDLRVDEPMLSMVATLRRAVRRSGARVPRARQAPLNSSMRAIKRKISAEMCRVSVQNIGPITHPITPN